MASIWLEETWADAAEEQTAKLSSAAASADFKMEALEFGRPDLRHDSR
jgi:hypothetical protein